jgi:hypothetical protein
MTNDHLVLISGVSGTGKSTCLRNIKNPEGVIYLNCEAGKKLPFKSKFQELVITDPMDVYAAFEQAAEVPGAHTIIVDSISMLLEMQETQYVLPSSNGMKAWGEYHQFFKRLMQEYVAKTPLNVIFTSHVKTMFNEAEMTSSVQANCKGALKESGIEAYFSTVVSTKKVTLKQLENYGSDKLNITEEDEMLGYKHCMQTRITKDTVNERIRGPLGMFETKETFIDGDAQVLLDTLHEYYA